MMRALLLASVLAVAWPAQAHRLDECLQAVRVSIARNRIALTVDITPGIEVAGAFHQLTDRDGDGSYSDSEKEIYAGKLLNELRMELDGEPVRLDLEEVVFPALSEMKKGLGVIRIKAGKTWINPVAGPHQLDLVNNHLQSISVYHVNALKPHEESVTILKQTRDALQREYRLEFRIAPR